MNWSSIMPTWTPEPTGPFTDAIKRKVRAHYAAQVMQIDHEVGQIMDAVEARGMLDNTVVIFSSDHGEFICCIIYRFL